MERLVKTIESLKRLLAGKNYSISPQDVYNLVFISLEEIRDQFSPKVTVKWKKMHPLAVLPKYAHTGDAALDLTCVETSEKNGNLECSFGWSVEIPPGFVGLLFPRSSIAERGLSLVNSVGVIDSGYRGPITAQFKFLTSKHNAYKPGERCAQMMILPIPKVEAVEVDTLSTTDRGSGGYGSTGA